jgi:hypothetical protein
MRHGIESQHESSQVVMVARSAAGLARRAGATGLEPATSGVTGRRSNQLNYAPEGQPVYLASPDWSGIRGGE